MRTFWQRHVFPVGWSWIEDTLIIFVFDWRVEKSRTCCVAEEQHIDYNGIGETELENNHSSLHPDVSTLSSNWTKYYLQGFFQPKSSSPPSAAWPWVQLSSQTQFFYLPHITKIQHMSHYTYIRSYKLTIRPAGSKIGALGMLGVGMLDATSTSFIVFVLCKPKIKVRFQSIWKRFFILCFIWGRWSQGHSGSYEIFYSYGSLGTNKGKRNLWTEHLEFSCPGTTCWWWEVAVLCVV